VRALAAGLLLAALACLPARADDRRSGYEFMSRETRAMQDDDAANPAMLWVLDGEALWNAAPAPGERACSGCHDDAAKSMKGVAARYPAFSRGLGRPVDLEQRINACRSGQQHAAPLRYESRELLALTAYVALQSRGMPIAVEENAGNRAAVEAGRAIFERRQGQLDLSCAQCHDQYAGKRLAGSVIPQAHPTGYPLYRLEWQSLGSLARRLRACLLGIRAEPYDYGSPELVELELYLMSRARGMKMDAPAVRP
jgi:sulfur-oxidizing protein SoxA